MGQCASETMEGNLTRVELELYHHSNADYTIAVAVNKVTTDNTGVYIFS